MRPRSHGAPAARARVALACLAVAAASGCDEGAAREPARSLLLVSIDTLRADRLGTYGYEAPTSPALDAFAARGVVFEHAWSESSWTLPSHVTLLSGRTPATHRVELPRQRIPGDLPLLAELLADAGLRTFGTTDGVFVSASRGFARGFERFDDRPKGLAVALHETRRFLQGLAPDERFFAFVHTYDVHCPYEPAPHVAPLFASPEAEPFDARGLCGNPALNAMDLGPGELRHLSDLYDASIREADGHLGAFLDQLEESGRLASTLVVVTSDHGEAFGEHGEVGHERSLHRELLHVPLVVVGPGVPAGSRRGAHVGLADVVPTVLEHLALPAAPGLEGRALLGPAAPRGARAGAQLARLRWQVGLDSAIAGEHHLLAGADGTLELFDWRADPLEATDLAGERPERSAELLRLVEEQRARAAARPPAPDLGPEDLDPEALERLQALGYVLDDA